MGVSYHSAFLAAAETRDLPVLSPRMERLFHEFLKHYQAWREAKRQERVWMCFLIVISAAILALPFYFAVRGFAASVVLFAVFYFAVGRCLEVSGRANRLSVNVSVLRHHLEGKLEAGFCEHGDSCCCAEDFRRYAAREYHIFFGSGRSC